jgi:hypothetical protein
LTEKQSAGLTGRAAFLPTPEQQSLLNACLFDGEEAIASWRFWRNTVDLKRIDMGSVRLLPLLAENLKRLGIDDPSFGTYRGVQRRTWARNQLLFHGAARVIEHLYDAGISVLALKGIVLGSTSYAKMSLRPMGDLDFLVKSVDRINALNELERLGWRVQGQNMRPRKPADFALRHSCAYEDPTNPEVSLDLHWRLIWAHHSAEAEAAVWQRAVAFEIGNTKCLAPCAADMLIHICAHGARWNPLPPLRWIVDAVFLLESQTIDWDYFCVQSTRLRLSLPLSDTLDYLRTVMRAPIPEQILKNLRRKRARPIERLIYETEMYPPERRSLRTALRIHWHIARTQIATSDVCGYLQYFLTLRAGRRWRDVAAWIRRRLTGDVT